MTTFQVGDTVKCRPITPLGETAPKVGIVNAVNLTGTTSCPYWVDFPSGELSTWYMPGELTLVEKTAALEDHEVFEPPVTKMTRDEVFGVTLNQDDPFEKVLIDIVTTNRRKRKDYAVDGSPWSNFDDTSDGMGVEGFGAAESAEHNVRQKLTRLRSLRLNGRMADPANEAVTDTYLDMAVYATIAYAIHRFPSGEVDHGREPAAPGS